MHRTHRSPQDLATGSGRSGRVRRRGPCVLLAAVLLLGFFAAPALADPHHSNEAGHPLRIAAYVLHPIGVVIDVVLFQPAHWVVHRADWLETLFGHEHDPD